MKGLFACFTRNRCTSRNDLRARVSVSQCADQNARYALDELVQGQSQRKRDLVHSLGDLRADRQKDSRATLRELEACGSVDLADGPSDRPRINMKHKR